MCPCSSPPSIMSLSCPSACHRLVSSALCINFDRVLFGACVQLTMTTSPSAIALKQSLSGVFGNFVSVALTYHLDVVKTRIQLPKSPFVKGVLHAYLHIIQKEGAGALYVGLAAEFVKTSIASFSYIYFYAYLNTWWEQFNYRSQGDEANKKPREVQLSTKSRLLFGLIAGILTRPIVNPVSLIQTRMLSSDLGFFALLIQVIQEEGIMGLFKGIVPSLILTTNPAIQWACFDVTKIMLSAYVNRKPSSVASSSSSSSSSASAITTSTLQICTCKERPSTPSSSSSSSASLSGSPPPSSLFASSRVYSSSCLKCNPSTSSVSSSTITQTPPSPIIPLSGVQLLVLGGIAKTIATLVTYPLILAKVRMQYKDASEYSSTFDCIRKVYMSDGLWGLFVGVEAQLSKSVIGAAIMYLAKEKFEQK